MLPDSIVSNSPEHHDHDPAPVPDRRSRFLAMGLRVILICGFLGVAGGVRLWQEQRVEAYVASGLQSPFSLRELPLQVGDWKGESGELDPYIARIAGSVDNAQYVYINQQTGVRLEVVVVYGPAAAVVGHAPEVCYPSVGFKQFDKTLHYDLNMENGRRPARFRSLVYVRGEGGQTEFQEVDYSWRYDGRWTPVPGDRQQIERVPSIFKIHVARAITPGELRNAANPSREFLALFVPQFERRLEAARSPRPSTVGSF